MAGARLDVASDPGKSAVGAGQNAAQRRQLTVMFCDLVGSTELSSRHELEDVHALLRDYLRACTECVEAAGGFVARYMGDGVLAYFGYPVGHENDAERAIAAAFSIRDAVSRMVAPDGAPLAVRSGIATGTVVVGDLLGAGPAEERSVVGETPNLAARLQAIAGRNRTVVSDTTRQLADGVFEFRDLGLVDLKGFPAGALVWEALGSRASADRFGARLELGLSPLVGRTREFETLLDCWAKLGTGRGRLVGLSAKAGVGKSRLLYEARRKIALTPHVWLEGAGVQIFRNTPFHAVAQMIRRWLDRATGAATGELFARLEQALRTARVTAPHALPLIADLIGVSTPNDVAPLTLNPDDRRAALMDALTEWLVRTAERWPTVMAVEDLHWADPSTLELLARIVSHLPATPLLLVYTSRAPLEPIWPATDHHIRLELGELDIDSIVGLLTGGMGQKLSARIVRRIAVRSGGVPLFAEELARLLSGWEGPIRDHAIPSKLSDLLTARLDQLGPDREAVQVASVLGMDFHLDLLSAVMEEDRETLSATLDRLTQADVLAASPGEGATHRFKHALIQDAAYDALLRGRRRELHRKAAQAIRGSFAALAERRPELLAYHWSGANETALAVAAWSEAGWMASDRRAYAEAERAFEQALAAMADLPPAPERDQRELELQSAFANVLQITQGYSAPDAVTASARARELAEAGDDGHQKFAQFAGQWMAASSAGDYGVAGPLADRLASLARAAGTVEERAAAGMIQMTSRYRMGNLLGAETSFAEGQPYFTAPEFRRWPGAAAQTFGNAAVNAWILGRPDEARMRIARALALSRETENPYEIAFAQYMAGMQAIMLSEPEAAEPLAAAALATALERGFPQFVATSRVVLGRARAGRGAPADGVAMMREGLTAMESTRSKAGLTMYLTWLGEAHLIGGDAAGALAILDHALTVNPTELFYRPEGLRVRAAARHDQGDVAGAGRDAGAALALAKDMGAWTFHQRALADVQAFRGG